jgi:hypothetical protein
MPLQRTRSRALLGRSPLNGGSLGTGRSAAVAAALGMVAVSSLGCHRGPSFDEYRSLVAKAAGEGATDCGVVKLGASKDEAIRCAESALGAREAVFVVFQVQGIDSQIFMGLAVDRVGKGTRLMWDSDAYGGGSRFMSKSWIDEVPCSRPALTQKNETVTCSPGA